MITNFYTTTISTKRLKTDQSAYEDNLSGIKCHIQQISGEAEELDEGAFYYLYNMWCAIVDINIGDQINDGTDDYQVKSKITYNIGGQPHLEAVIAKPL